VIGCAAGDGGAAMWWVGTAATPDRAIQDRWRAGKPALNRAARFRGAASADGDPAARNVCLFRNSWSLHEARSEAPAEVRIEKE
jgi:hypothetical protein